MKPRDSMSYIKNNIEWIVNPHMCPLYKRQEEGTQEPGKLYFFLLPSVDMMRHNNSLANYPNSLQGILTTSRG